MAIHEGQVAPDGVALRCEIHPTSRLFPLAVGTAPYDVTEMSVSSYVLQVSRGEGAYTAIPVFVSRAFRHSGFFARADSGIDSPADLAGRRVGVPEYQMTAALWMRGILADEYGVDVARIHWHTGALDTGIRRERLKLDLPAGMVVEPIEEGRTLQELLLSGEIDGLLAPRPPQAFLDGDPRIVRLLPDFEAVEREYHARTGFFPIMHVIGVRKSLARAHPWMPMALYQAFAKAKELALERLRAVWLGNANRISLPWLGASMERTIEAFGADCWPYGFRRNRQELAAICRYSAAQFWPRAGSTPRSCFRPGCCRRETGRREYNGPKQNIRCPVQVGGYWIWAQE